MKNITKKTKMRDLLAYTLDSLLSSGDISLNEEGRVEQGCVRREICGKDSIILWQEHSYEELRLTIWWGYKKDDLSNTSSTEPLVHEKRINQYLDLCCSCWVERKTGKYIQGFGSEGLFDSYCSKGVESDLMKIKSFKSPSFDKEGVYHFQ